jgi:hypothetical protein
MARASLARRRRCDRSGAFVSMRFALTAILLVAAAGPALAGEPQAPRKTAGDSLLFSSATLALIEGARHGDRQAPDAAAPGAPFAPAAIHLSAIVYHAPDDWRIWLNGQSFTPAAVPGALEILAVSAGTVRLAWHGGPGPQPRRFELEPNQSYLVASGRIVEGARPWRPTAPTVAGARR